ncbi:hypothetical protein FRACYDRAFT_250245 [Fragilariopsis cylindrus CCMP1102]|uniref:Uncharacterized protein n=1 Tax=Fragilariopsis cylindrus CCMP1102 TaxID=635003 RepID=A0A1E7EQ81_9STRA|nr:hypothetical protein FRACYDRAFT_250245 [Fragilariopsis cylindrus CCMP1102]|eukprot:OEU08025.1 hypothetical protein FRACYDRAFT_250245 [Fragilariopsis cylindrus CCMP1102]
MSTTTVDLNRRLSVLEARIGITSAKTASSSSTTQNTNVNVNERLIQLRLNYERKIAGVANSNSNSTSLLSSTNTDTTNNKELWSECIKLLKELDPDIGLTHQQQPLLYKRQQILASSSDMKNDFHQLDMILNLLLKDTRVGYCGNSGNSSSGGSAATATTSAYSSNNDSALTGADKDNDTANKAAGQSSSSEHQQQQQNKTKLKQQEEEQQRQQRSGGGSAGNNILRLDQVLQAPIVSSDYYGATNINPDELKRLEILRVKLLDLNNRSTVLSQQLRHYLECYHTTMQAVSNKIVLADEKIKSCSKSKTTK